MDPNEPPSVLLDDEGNVLPVEPGDDPVPLPDERLIALEATLDPEPELAGLPPKRVLTPYPAALDPAGPAGTWRTVVPDLPGCAAEGGSALDAMRATSAALAAWIEGARTNGRTPELPSPMDVLARLPEFHGHIWFFVESAPEGDD